MSARMMTAERLAEVREMCSPLARRHASWDAIHDAVAHIDALAEDLADRATEAEWSTKRAVTAEAKLAALAKLYKAWDLVARDGASFDNDLAAETFLKAARPRPAFDALGCRARLDGVVRRAGGGPRRRRGRGVEGGRTMTAIGTAMAFPFLIALLAYCGHAFELWAARRWPVGRGVNRKGGA